MGQTNKKKTTNTKIINTASCIHVIYPYKIMKTSKLQLSAH